MGKAKGASLLPSVKVLRSRKEEALQVLPSVLHHYLEDRIVVASWYPDSDWFGLMMACAKLVATDFESIGAALAHMHLDGIYANLLHRDPGVRVHTLWKTQHDTGELRVTSLTADSATYALEGWEHVGVEHCRLLGGFLSEMHKMAGAAEPSFEHTACKGRAARHCVWVVRWKPA